jgi:phosphoglycolate phosphatase
MTEPRPFDLLVFDWDGTLVDSEALIVASMQAAAVALGLRPVRTDRVKDVIGLSLPEALRVLFPTHTAAVRERLASAYRRHYFSPAQPPGLFPGAREAIQRLAEQGYLLAVATGKGRRGLDEGMAETELGAFFHATRTAEETASKPDPMMLREIMAELGVEPARTLMIGDSEYDMVMARNAGSPAVAVCYGVHPRERLLPHGPLTCVDSLVALHVWLGVQAHEDPLPNRNRM